MTETITHRAALASTRAGMPGPVHLVPTMGALHEGHAALLRAARAEAATVVMSVFVNPLQFNDPTDLVKYPRTLEHDLAVAEECGVDVVWTPADQEMYPEGRPSVTVTVRGVGDTLEGEHRPGHFDGVATVVTKLFNQVRPDAAWFGRKDAQQLAVVERLVADLDLGVEIRPHPTVRAADGLALSSRNARLSEADRVAARCLSRGLFAAADRAEAGERDARVLESACGEGLEYAALADARRFTRLTVLDRPAVLAVAAGVGPVRLIDNVFLDIDPGGNCVADRGGYGGPGDAAGVAGPPFEESRKGP